MTFFILFAICSTLAIEWSTAGHPTCNQFTPNCTPHCYWDVDMNRFYCCASVCDPKKPPNPKCTELEACRSMHGGWTKWGPWSSCPAKCDSPYANLTRTRSCTNPTPRRDLNGFNCEGKAVQLEPCHLLPDEMEKCHYKKFSITVGFLGGALGFSIVIAASAIVAVACLRELYRRKPIAEETGGIDRGSPETESESGSDGTMVTPIPSIVDPFAMTLAPTATPTRLEATMTETAQNNGMAASLDFVEVGDQSTNQLSWRPNVLSSDLDDRVLRPTNPTEEPQAPPNGELTTMTSDDNPHYLCLLKLPPIRRHNEGSLSVDDRLGSRGHSTGSLPGAFDPTSSGEVYTTEGRLVSETENRIPIVVPHFASTSSLDMN